MSYIDIFNQRNVAYGSTLRDVGINNTKRTITNSFYDSPSYYQVQLTTASTPTASIPLDVWIVDDSKTIDLKIMSVIPDKTLNYGDLVLWSGDYWLTLLVDNMGGIYYRGSIQKCLSSLKWLDTTGATKEAPFILTTDTQRTVGLNEGKIMFLPDERRYITVQNNADTLKIAKGQRFIFDGNRAWQTVSANALSTGLIKLELQETTIDPARDRVDLRIADYIQNPPSTGGNLW